MKKYITLTIAALALAATSVFGDISWTFDDTAQGGNGGGTPSSGFFLSGATFSFDIFANWTGSSPSPDFGGVSLWFESELFNGSTFNDQGGSFSVVSMNHTGSVFESANTGNPAGPMTFGTDSADNSFDLGAFDNEAAPATSAGTYFIGTITFQITGPVVNGQVWQLQSIFAPTGTTTDTPGHGSVGGNNSGGDSFDIPSSNYTVNIVPEPATWTLVALGGLGSFGLTLLRARRKS